MNVFFRVGVLYITAVLYIGVFNNNVFLDTVVFCNCVFFGSKVVFYANLVILTWRLRRGVHAAEDMLSPYSPTTGRILAHSSATVVSWPAKEGIDAWEDLVNVQGLVSFCCVWTGRENSPTEEWLYPWEDNMIEALNKNLLPTMIFVVPNDGKLGAGQTIEWLWCLNNDLHNKGLQVRTIAEVMRHGVA